MPEIDTGIGEKVEVEDGVVLNFDALELRDPRTDMSIMF